MDNAHLQQNCGEDLPKKYFTAAFFCIFHLISFGEIIVIETKPLN